MSTAALDPIVAIATAPGRGAVGIVRVSGHGLMPLARALTGGRALAPRHAHYGPFTEADGSPIDHGLALRACHACAWRARASSPSGRS